VGSTASLLTRRLGQVQTAADEQRPASRRRGRMPRAAAPHDDLRRGSRPPAVQQPVRRVLAVRRPRADPRALRPRLRSRARRPLPSSLPVRARVDRAVHLVDAAARILAHPRVSVGCPYTGPIRGHRVRQRPPGSLRFFTHAMGCDGVGNAWKVNGIQEVGSSTLLGSTIFRGLSGLGCDPADTTNTTPPISPPAGPPTAARLRAREHYVAGSAGPGS
jgi:hypothetical protein